MPRLPAVAVALLTPLFLSSAADAQRRRARERVTTKSYTAMDKLGRGLAGMTTGVLELPGNIVAVNREENAGAAATIGFGKGLGMIPVRELVGVYEFITAPLPVPSGYRPVLSPDYPWEYFQGAHSAGFGAD